MLRFAWRGGYDLIHSHGYKANILLGMVPRAIRRIPVVATLHGWTSTGKLNKMRLYEWMDSLSLHFIESVVLVNRAMRARVRLNRIHIVDNGIPPLTCSLPGMGQGDQILVDHKITDFCRTGFTFGAIGRLSEEKGFGLLLEAIRSVSETYSDVRLVIIGEGGERQFLEAKAAELGISERVIFPGYRVRASRYLPCFDTFVLSSLTEGLPIVILEAMQAGVPIIATKVGGVPEVLEHGKAGMLVDSSDPVALSKAMIQLMEEPALRSGLAGRARKVVQEKYSSRRMAEEYQNIYNDLVISRPNLLLKH